MRAFIVSLAFVAVTCAYRVTQPNASNGWTNIGPQLVVWERVGTDPVNFTIVLTDVDRSSLSQNQVLTAEQDGVGQSRTMVNPPSAGWPTGTGFRVNLVRDVNNLDTILAQSGDFNITAPTSAVTVPIVRPTIAPTLSGPGFTPPAVTPSVADGNTNTGAASATTISSGLITLFGAATYLLA